jgi:hypothetical protein
MEPLVSTNEDKLTPSDARRFTDVEASETRAERGATVGSASKHASGDRREPRAVRPSRRRGTALALLAPMLAQADRSIQASDVLKSVETYLSTVTRAVGSVPGWMDHLIVEA